MKIEIKEKAENKNINLIIENKDKSQNNKDEHENIKDLNKDNINYKNIANDLGLFKENEELNINKWFIFRRSLKVIFVIISC